MIQIILLINFDETYLKNPMNYQELLKTADVF